MAIYPAVCKRCGSNNTTGQNAIYNECKDCYGDVTTSVSPVMSQAIQKIKRIALDKLQISVHTINYVVQDLYSWTDLETRFSVINRMFDSGLEGRKETLIRYEMYGLLIDAY